MNTAKRIVVQSVIGAHYFTCEMPWACISIVTEENSWPKISEANRVGLLQLAFADIDAAEGDDKGAFNEDHAHRILDFVKEVWDRIGVLMVHCEEGNSRGSSRLCFAGRRECRRRCPPICWALSPGGCWSTVPWPSGSRAST